MIATGCCGPRGPAPLRTGLDRLHQERGAERFPAPGEVLVDASALSTAEKTLILFRHAKAANLPPELRAEVRAHGAEIVAPSTFHGPNGSVAWSQPSGD